MFGSYGSYSSMSLASAPIDISSGYRANGDSCAFPSWPRRSSLSDSEHEPRATSFLSDDDLFLCDPFEDDARSISSSGSSSSPGMDSPPQISQPNFLELERERLAIQREFVRQATMEKERRRQQAARKRRSYGAPAKKSPAKSKISMSAIPEACE